MDFYAKKRKTLIYLGCSLTWININNNKDFTTNQVQIWIDELEKKINFYEKNILYLCLGKLNKREVDWKSEIEESFKAIREISEEIQRLYTMILLISDGYKIVYE